jgi:hypothetical protein
MNQGEPEEINVWKTEMLGLNKHIIKRSRDSVVDIGLAMGWMTKGSEFESR